MLTASQADAQAQLDSILCPSGLPFDTLRWRPPDVGRRGAGQPYDRLQYGSPFSPCLPAFTPATSDELSDLGGDSRQITPNFIPGVQDHYTGLLKQQPQIAPPPGLEEAKKVPAEQEADNKAAKVDVPRNDVKKLESLIWLYLRTSQDDTAPPSSIAEPTPSTSFSSSNTQTSPLSSPITEDIHLAEECPAPPVDAREVVFSCGSVGHPDSCNEACKYARKKRGCKDGLACSRCHFCTWYHKRIPKTPE